VKKLTATMLFVSVGGAWCAAALAQAPVAPKPDVPKSVWGRVYTAEQARRGDSVYFERCVDCHADDLIGELWTKIRRDMPRDKPGTLTTEEALDVMAFILQANEYPEGKTPLTDDVGGLREITMPLVP
jgi:cytochrome c